MSKETPEKELDCGDDTKRDQVLKKLLGTPPQPKKPPPKKSGKKNA
jgi:hypothetical protein